MKPAAFTLETPVDLAAAAKYLRATPEARVMAGGQSLGPMLNLRVARPNAVVGISGLAELRGVSQTSTHVIIGAAVTHGQIADGLAPDIGQNILARIAENIAYRAVRNRGTIGGSLCHADPAADWPCTLLALGAEAILFAANHPARAVALEHFFTGAFRTILGPGEILRAIRVPRLPSGARWGYFKACRKPGEFAHAMAAVLDQNGVRRVVFGAMGGPPLLLQGAATQPERAAEILTSAAGGLDAIDRHRQMVALRRACLQAGL